MTNKIYIANTSIEGVMYHFDQLFSYIIPDELVPNIKPGMRVIVPFGNGNKSKIAFVISISEVESSDTLSTLKKIKSVQDKETVISREMIDCALFMASRYFCTVYECIKAMLPVGINYRISKCYTVIDLMPEFTLTPTQQDIFNIIKNSKMPIDKNSIQSAFEDDIGDDLAYLINNRIIREIDNPIRKIKDAMVKSIRLISDDDNFKLTPKQKEVYEILKITGSASVKEICYYTGVTPAVTDALVKKNLAEYFDEEYFRIPETGITSEHEKTLTLSKQQQQVYDNLLTLYNEGKAHISLLYGITGSGKTSVFMHLIDKVVKDNRGVIVMVPEIALTPQLIGLFKARYSDLVAVFHSGLSMGERLDEYKRVKNGEAKIAIGTRSAVFAPFDDIGLIVIDEEQEHTYKSESSPRYHARDIAKFRCLKHNALLLLSSATPSLESMYYAKTGKYSLNVLSKRYGTAVLPKVIVADMNTELEHGNRTAFSSDLLDAIEDNLNNGKQSIILLNRRGHNTYVSCKNCGKIVDCPNCSISLTYHSANNRLMCHYCGYSIKFDKICPTCSSQGLRLSGTGTQRAEEDLKEIFPDARILRLDADSTLKKHSHERLLSDFAKGEYDILLGTQMVAKGLNFPNVTLVGVLSADNVLYGNDFRSYEKAFSLLTQVVGRSGRGEEKGIAVIQTKTPENPVISLASQQDYDSFFESDIKIRKAMLYPPFSDICVIVFSSEDKELSYKASQVFSAELCNMAREKYPELPLRVLGPSPAEILRVNGKYRYKLVLKFRNSKDFREMMSLLLKNAGRDKNYRNVYVYADINPESIL